LGTPEDKGKELVVIIALIKNERKAEITTGLGNITFEVFDVSSTSIF
jgi:hypothetical protein